MDSSVHAGSLTNFGAAKCVCGSLTLFGGGKTSLAALFTQPVASRPRRLVLVGEASANDVFPDAKADSSTVAMAVSSLQHNSANV